MKNEMREKYVATLLGCGIGDTLGMAVEGWRPAQIKKYLRKVIEPIAPVILYDSKGEIILEDEFGKFGYYTQQFKKGEYTDDTILTLAIAESIVGKGKLDLEDICFKQLEAYDLCGPKGFGHSTREAFENIRNGVGPLESGVSPGMGNGTSMKMSPVGLYMHASGNYDEGIEMARLIGQATHKDERAVAAGIVQAHAIYELLGDVSKEDFLKSVLRFAEKNEKDQDYETLADRGNLTEKIRWVFENRNVSDLEARKYLKVSCLAFESYPFTLFMFQKYWDRPFEGLIETVNMGGDCDTTGAMYGALAGAKNGIFFPRKWLNELQNSKRIEDVANKIYEVGRK